MAGEVEILNSNKLKIVIVGIGNIGKRHVESLMKLSQPFELYIVDKEINSEQNQIFISNFKNNPSVSILTFNSLENVKGLFDIGIIATNSLQRFNILEQLLKKCNLKYLILEKFLFPYIEQYEKAHQLIRSNEVKAYVNCGRREWESYKKLQVVFKNEKNVQIEVIGGNWNLGSNLIHFVDLFHYFTEFESISFNIVEDSLKIIESKRNGYINFLGNINVMDNNGNKLLLKASEDINDGISRIRISSDNYQCVLNERRGLLTLNNEEMVFELENVSDLTGKIITSLLGKNRCNLTEYDFSMKFHLSILNAFSKSNKLREGVIT